MLDNERLKITYSTRMSSGDKGEKSVGTSVNPSHTTVVAVHVHPLEQALIPLLSPTEDKMNDQTISHIICL